MLDDHLVHLRVMLAGAERAYYTAYPLETRPMVVPQNLQSYCTRRSYAAHRPVRRHSQLTLHFYA